MAVAIVTDSTAYLAPARVAQLRAESGVGFEVVPLHVVVGGKEHREGIDAFLAKRPARF